MRDQDTNERHAERDRGKEGQGDKICVREKVKESINHSYAPVRVVSGTKRNHMQLYNIPRPPASRTGSQQTSPAPSPGRPITPCTMTRRDSTTSIGATDTCILLLLLLLLLVTFILCMRLEISTDEHVSQCMCVIGILDRIDVCAYTLIKAVPLSTL